MKSFLYSRFSFIVTLFFFFYIISVFAFIKEQKSMIEVLNFIKKENYRQLDCPGNLSCALIKGKIR